nr:hypothetical protein [uncultured Actinomyces sp.]
MTGQRGAATPPEDARRGVGERVTVPVTLSPEEAARDLAPRLRALAKEAAGASSMCEAAPAGVPVVTIDGYSGSGKSTLAAALERQLEGWQILHLDDWYPGWDGLAEGARVARAIAHDLRAGRPSSYVTWVWEASAPGHAVRVPLAPAIIEGCGALEAEADLSVWIADPGEEERRSRAIARDGQTYAPHWQRWARQDLGRPVK